MALLAGIDLGTSSLKVILCDERGVIKSQGGKSFEFSSPRAGFAEQDPEIWWDACKTACREAVSKIGAAAPEIKAVSFSGQMHGAVLFDKNYQSIRPVILHCDTRSGLQTQRIKALYTQGKVSETQYNPAYTGFLLSSLLWVKDNEPGLYEKIRFVCLPKDYLKLRLCGAFSTEFSDASGTLAFDVENLRWSGALLSALDLDESIFPKVFESSSVTGRVSPKAAEETGLPEGALVVSGGGDQVMQAIGNGAVLPGQATVNIGSSGQVCFQAGRPIRNPALSTNTFCAYRIGAWITMGAIMSAGLAFKWFTRLFGGGSSFAGIDDEAAKIPAGSGGLLFLPYLAGERTPHLNPDLRGAFLGLGLGTGRAELARAVMEGVAFGLNECIEVCSGLGLSATELIASGGGARSALWLQIQADIFGIPLKVAETEEQAALGAACVAAAGAGMYPSVAEASSAMVRYKDKRYLANERQHMIYKEYYGFYKKAFTGCGAVLSDLTKFARRGPAD